MCLRCWCKQNFNCTRVYDNKLDLICIDLLIYLCFWKRFHLFCTYLISDLCVIKTFVSPHLCYKSSIYVLKTKNCIDSSLFHIQCAPVTGTPGTLIYLPSANLNEYSCFFYLMPDYLQCVLVKCFFKHAPKIFSNLCSLLIWFFKNSTTFVVGR